MKIWLSRGLETFKIFIVFSACLLAFYYGILWLSESYDGDQRLQRTDTDARQVHLLDHSKLSAALEKEGNAVEDGSTGFYTLLPGRKRTGSQHSSFL